MAGTEPARGRLAAAWHRHGPVLVVLAAVLLLLFGTFYLSRALIRRPVPAGGPPASTHITPL